MGNGGGRESADAKASSRGNSGRRAERRSSRYRSLDRTSSPSAEMEGRSLLSIGGLALLTATKFADALTTGIGITYVPGIYEANPIVRPVFHEVGLSQGLILSSFVLIVGITVITEASSIVVSVRRQDGHLAPLVRIVGYGIPSVVFAVIAIYNVQVLLAGLEHADWFIVGF